MKKHGLLLERHTGRRRVREHDGQVATIRSNCRWCSDALEFSCWNGEVVRVAFALDCHDREAISWVATTAGISGEMVRDMMVRCVEKRFGTIRAPHPVQWLSDNGSIFAAHKTIEIALARDFGPTSASGTVARPGFDQLVAWLCAGRVGAALCFDASQLPATVATGTICSSSAVWSRRE